MLRREKYEKENDRWENKNGNKTHWQCSSSKHTSPIVWKSDSPVIVNEDLYSLKDVYLEASWEHAVSVETLSSVVVFYWFFLKIKMY